MEEISIFEIVQVAVGILQVLAVAAIPYIVWRLSVKQQDRKQKEDAKFNLFISLMANRKPFYSNKQRLDAFNTIDVIFQDNQKVRLAWREYYNSMLNNSPHFNQQNAYLLDLLSEMAYSLGYKNLKQTEIDRYFFPEKDYNQILSQEAIISGIANQYRPQPDNKEIDSQNEGIEPKS